MWWRNKGPSIVHQLNVVQELTARFRDVLSIFGLQKDGKRDLNQIYGYTENPEFQYFFDMYSRSGYANRVVDALPKSCWREGVSVMVGDNVVLEDEIKALKRLGLFQKLERADILNRIGRYSVLFIGLPDGLKADMPAGSIGSDFEGVYFSPYKEDDITITRYESDPANERYGKPTQYELSVTRADGQQSTAEIRQPIKVHWSRIVHMAEGALNNDIEGRSSLLPIANRIEDLNKSVGGAAEAYFRNASGKVALEIDKDFNASDTKALDQFKEEVEGFNNGMQNFMRLIGVKAHTLNTTHYDPTGTAKVSLQEVAAQTGMRMRILTGEGGGQLAGNEDKESWNNLVSDRQEQVCSLWLLRALQILAEAGGLKLPDEFRIEWPVVEALNEKDRADIGNKKADTLVKLTTAKSTIGGDEIDMESAIPLLGLDGLKVDSLDG